MEETADLSASAASRFISLTKDCEVYRVQDFGQASK